jgi:hypothetical protein
MKKALLMVLFLALFAGLGYSATWYNETWQYTEPIIIDNTYVDVTTNATFLVHLNDSLGNFDFSHDAAGTGIRFVDAANTTLYDFERVVYNTTSNYADFYVRIPSISSSAETTFFIYYGNTSEVTDLSSQANTWYNEVMVEHLTNGYNGSFADSARPGSCMDARGATYGAFCFDGNDDFLYTNKDIAPQTGTYFLRARADNWIDGGYQHLLDEPMDSYSLWQFEPTQKSFIKHTNGGQIYDYIYENGNWTDGEYATMATSYTTSNYSFYLNNRMMINKTFGGLTASATGVVLATYRGVSQYWWNGTIDMFVWFDRALSAEELKVMHSAENMTLLTFGSETESPAAAVVNTTTISSPDTKAYESIYHPLTFTVIGSESTYNVSLYLDDSLITYVTATNNTAYEYTGGYANFEHEGNHTWEARLTNTPTDNDSVEFEISALVNFTSVYFNTSEEEVTSQNMTIAYSLASDKGGVSYPYNLMSMSDVWIDYNGTNYSITPGYSFDACGPYTGGPANGTLITPLVLTNSSEVTFRIHYNATIFNKTAADACTSLVNTTVRNTTLYYQNLTYVYYYDSYPVNWTTLLEWQWFTPSFTFANTSGLAYLNGTVRYNNTYYSLTRSGQNFSTSLITPQGFNGTKNLEFWFNVTYGSVTRSTNATTDATSHVFYLDNCVNGTTLTYNATLWDLLENVRITSLNYSSFFGTYYATNASYSKQINVTNSSTNEFDLCLYPASATLYLTGVTTLQRQNYLDASYYRYNASMTSTQEDHKMYTLTDSSTNATLYNVKVVNTLGQALEDYNVMVQAKIGGTYQTYTQGLTASTGIITFPLKTGNTYKFYAFDQEGNLRTDPSPNEITAASDTIITTLVANLTITDWGLIPDSIEYTCTNQTGWDNDTKIYSCSVIDNSGKATQFKLEVLTQALFNTTVLCTNTTTSSSATLECNLSAVNFVTRGFYANLYAYYNGNWHLINTQTIYVYDFTMNYGDTGYFMALLLFIGCVLTGIWTPAYGLLMGFLGLIAIHYMGLAPISAEFIAIFLIMAGVVIYKMRT